MTRTLLIILRVYSFGTLNSVEKCRRLFAVQYIPRNNRAFVLQFHGFCHGLRRKTFQFDRLMNTQPLWEKALDH